MNEKEAPNPKLQAPEKHQAPIFNARGAAPLRFGDWNFSGVWRLEFGISNL
jgi:hypothetical protein